MYSWRVGFAFLLCLLQIVTIESRGGFRVGGGSRGISRGFSSSRSRPVYRPSAVHTPIYRPPPSPVFHPPAHIPSPPHTSGSSSFGGNRPIGFVNPSSNKPINSGHHVGLPVHTKPLNNAATNSGGGSSSGSRPIGFVDPSSNKPISSGHAVGPPVHTQPLNNPATHNGGSSSGGSKPIGFVDPSNHKPMSPNNPGTPVGPPVQSKPLNNAAGGNHYGERPPPYNPHYNSPPLHNPAGYGPPPAYNPAGYGPPPAYNPAHNTPGFGPPPPYSPSLHPGNSYHPQNNYHPQGQPGNSYHPQNAYHPQGHPGGVTIINNNINNHHTGSYGGGWPSYTPVHYTTSDTGSGTLGFFLGYSLAKLSTPSYHYYNRYDYGYTPRYDHYEIHHYYHNNQHVPKEVTIEPNTFVNCYGDSASICPPSTTALCTNNGAVMCAVSASSTVPCTDEKQAHCARTSIPCKENNGPECKSSNQAVAPVTIPCISTAKVHGNISYVNNSIVISNHTGSNITLGATIMNVTETNLESTRNNNNSSNSTLTVSPLGTNSSNGSSGAPKSTVEKKENAFCVIILALPAERQLTKGEQLLVSSKSVFSKFLVKTLGID